MIDNINKSIIESISDPLIISKEGKIVEVNHQLLKFLNQDSEEELINSSLESFFDRKIKYSNNEGMIKEKVDFSFGKNLFKAEIVTFQFDTDYKGHILLDLSTWVESDDFTEYYYNDDIIMIIDPEDGRIVDFNKTALSFYGYTLSEFKKMKISDINSLTDNQVREAMDEAEKENNNFFFFKHITAYGKIEDVKVYSRPVELKKQKLLLSRIVPLSEANKGNVIDEFISRVPLGLVIINTDGRIINANNGFCEMFKYSFSEIINKNITNLICNDSDKGFSEKLLSSIADGYVIKEEITRYTKYLDKLYVNLTGFILKKNEHDKMILMYSDFTEKVKKDREIKVFKNIMSRSSEGIALISHDDKITWCNHSFTDILKLDSEKIEEIDLSKILKMICIDREDLVKVDYESEVVFHDNQGNIRICLIKFKEIDHHSETDNRFVLSLYDLTKLREKEKHIYMMSITDNLTGLYNRKYIEKYLDLLMKKDREFPLQVTFIDIDHFKKINDTYGHDIGDEVLIEVSKLLYIKFNNDKVGRYGGDEFLIVSRRKQEEVIKDMYQLIKAFKEIKVRSVLEGISASIGLVSSSDILETKVDLIKNADKAMYKSKNQTGSFLTIIEK